MPIFLPSSIRLISSALLRYIFIILILSFSSRCLFSSLIIIKSSRLILLFINASDILLSMLLNLLLASITILLCFFFLLSVVFNRFFTIPVEIENAMLKLALTVPTGAPMTVTSDAIEMLPVVTDKTISDLSK